MHHCWKKAVGVLCCWGIMTGLSITSYADNFDQVQLVEAKESAGAEYIELAEETDSQKTDGDVVNVTNVSNTSNASNGASVSGGVVQTKVYDRTAETIASQEAEKEAKAKAEAVAKAAAEAAQAAAEAAALAKTDLRQQVVNFALSFVGGPYRYGGSDPRTGVDCSGFTSYVMRNAAGVNLARSSKGQANNGVAISAEQMQPGDLIFYGGSGGINHVAMYIGGGKIVHASTYSTGIKVSNWNYRTPVKIVNVLG